jgi:hypothetical protein
MKEKSYKISVQVHEPLYREWKLRFAKEGGTFQATVIGLLENQLKVEKEIKRLRMKRDQKKISPNPLETIQQS